MSIDVRMKKQSKFNILHKNKWVIEIRRQHNIHEIYEVFCVLSGMSKDPFLIHKITNKRYLISSVPSFLSLFSFRRIEVKSTLRLSYLHLLTATTIFDLTLFFLHSCARGISSRRTFCSE